MAHPPQIQYLREFTLFAFVLWLAFVTVDTSSALPAASRSVRIAMSAESDFPSGFQPRGCEAALGLLESSSDNFAALDLRERIRRLHGLAFFYQGAPSASDFLNKDFILRLADLATIDPGQLTPFRHELLVLIARLDQVLRDRPDRSGAEYYGVRAFIERVVNLKHDDTQRDHALIAHALARLAELRVSRLGQVARFDEHVRAAYEDLDRLQREDALGDNNFLRLRASLKVIAHVIAAFTMYEPVEQPWRATELLERLDPVEDAVRALASRRLTIDETQLAAITACFDEVLNAVNIDQLPAIKVKVMLLRDHVLNRPAAGGAPPQR